jgi:hypothetical protein
MWSNLWAYTSGGLELVKTIGVIVVKTGNTNDAQTIGHSTLQTWHSTLQNGMDIDQQSCRIRTKKISFMCP